MPTMEQISNLIYLHDQACQEFLDQAGWFNLQGYAWSANVADMYEKLTIYGANLGRQNNLHKIQKETLEKNLDMLSTIKNVAIKKGLV